MLASAIPSLAHDLSHRTICNLPNTKKILLGNIIHPFHLIIHDPESHKKAACKLQAAFSIQFKGLFLQSCNAVVQSRMGA